MKINECMNRLYTHEMIDKLIKRILFTWRTSQFQISEIIEDNKKEEQTN